MPWLACASHGIILSVIKTLTTLIGCVLLCSCTHWPSPHERKMQADQLAAGWQAQVYPTSYFSLMTYQPAAGNKADNLTIYIEGDGFACVSASSPSLNPTPINPLALKLALKDPGPAAYIARPCQFVALNKEQLCRQQYWTSHRFSEEVIQSTNEVVNLLKAKYHAQNISLVGYSGGGAVATLVAARRHDVVGIITIAGNLDHQYWTQTQHLSPLAGSLNPADFADDLHTIPQLHYVGAEDKVMPVAVAQAYKRHFKNADRVKIIEVSGFSHQCCWLEEWPGMKLEF